MVERRDFVDTRITEFNSAIQVAREEGLSLPYPNPYVDPDDWGRIYAEDGLPFTEEHCDLVDDYLAQRFILTADYIAMVMCHADPRLVHGLDFWSNDYDVISTMKILTQRGERSITVQKNGQTLLLLLDLYDDQGIQNLQRVINRHSKFLQEHS